MNTHPISRRRPRGRTALPSLFSAALALAIAPAISPPEAAAQPCTQSVGGSGFQRVPLINGLEGPMSFQEDPVTGLIFVVEKGGALKVFDPLDTSITTIATLTVNTQAELGLLGIALDPAFSTNGHVFLYYVKDVASVPTGRPRCRRSTSRRCV